VKLPISLRRIARKILHSPGIRKALIWYRHRGLTSEDVFLGSYPRSGSTWLQFLLCEILTANSPEFVEVNRIIPYVGRHNAAPAVFPDGGRLIKTHEPYSRVYSNAIYLVRDPRDVLISEYKYMRMTSLYRKDFQHFFDDFLKGKVHAFGNWVDHVECWLKGIAESPDRILLLMYEDLKENTTSELARVLDNLDVSYTEETLTNATRHNSIEQMKIKENKARETYFRGFKSGFRFVNEGDVGGWKESLDRYDQDVLTDQFEPLMRRLRQLRQA
jgi:hypothetical protein